MLEWFKNLFTNPEPIEPWDLYVFPGGKVGEATNRSAVAKWMKKNHLTLGELRAINRDTKDHMVRYHSGYQFYSYSQRKFI